MSHQTVKQSAVVQAALTIIRLRFRNVCIQLAICVYVCVYICVQHYIAGIKFYCAHGWYCSYFMLFIRSRNLSGHLTHRRAKISETICLMIDNTACPATVICFINEILFHKFQIGFLLAKNLAAIYRLSKFFPHSYVCAIVAINFRIIMIRNYTKFN